MGWLSKIFKGSSHKGFGGQYDWRYGTDMGENHQSTSWVRSYFCLSDIDKWNS